MQGVAVVDSGELLDKVAQGSGFGGTFAVVLVSARWLLTWMTGRHDRREDLIEAKDAALDGRWSKYTKKIEDRCDKLEERCLRMEQEVDSCHADKMALERRLAKLEGYGQGMGTRRQEQQISNSLQNLIGEQK